MQIIFTNNITGSRTVCDEDDLKYLMEDEGLTENDVTVLPPSEFTPEEHAIILGNMLEDANYHSLAKIPERFLKELTQSCPQFTDSEKSNIVIALASVMERII